MSASGVLIAGLWGYAEADPTLVAILVALVLAFAIVYLALRANSRRNPGTKTRKDAGKRG